jgi:hypothetical protein
VRGRSRPMITSCDVRRPRGRLCRWTAAFAKASACWPDCRFSRVSAIHSRIMARRTFCLAIWIAFRGVGGGAHRGLVEIDRLRSGEASALSIAPFAGLQAACHARLLDSHGSISSGRDLISRALQPRFYMSRIRSEHSLRHKLHPGSEGYLRLGGTIPLLEKDEAAPLEFTRSSVHLLGKLHRPWRARRTAGALIAQLTCSHRPARGDFANSPTRHFALLGGQDAGLSCIYRWVTRPTHRRGSIGLY